MVKQLKVVGSFLKHREKGNDDIESLLENELKIHKFHNKMLMGNESDPFKCP